MKQKKLAEFLTSLKRDLLLEKKMNKIIEINDNKFLLGYRKDIPEEEVRSIEDVIKRAIKESQKPRCKACIPCPMGVDGCEWDDLPHGHGSLQRCSECGILFYHIHPHSNVCSKATPIKDDVRHDNTNLEWQLKRSDKEKKVKK